MCYYYIIYHSSNIYFVFSMLHLLNLSWFLWRVFTRSNQDFSGIVGWWKAITSHLSWNTYSFLWSAQQIFCWCLWFDNWCCCSIQAFEMINIYNPILVDPHIKWPTHSFCACVYSVGIAILNESFCVSQFPSCGPYWWITRVQMDMIFICSK